MAGVGLVLCIFLTAHYRLNPPQRGAGIGVDDGVTTRIKVIEANPEGVGLQKIRSGEGFSIIVDGNHDTVGVEQSDD